MTLSSFSFFQDYTPEIKNHIPFSHMQQLGSRKYAPGTEHARRA